MSLISLSRLRRFESRNGNLTKNFFSPSMRLRSFTSEKDIPSVYKYEIKPAKPMDLSKPQKNLFAFEKDSMPNSTGIKEAKRLTKEEEEAFKRNSMFTIEASELFKHSERNTDGYEDLKLSEFEQYIAKSIRLRGPMNVAQYMREALMNPKHGYYVSQNNKVFGTKGDFITSPEISQMFGELIGIWCIATWEQMGMPKEIIVAECGPGRGTLMADLLRAADTFPQFKKCIKGIHLVEGSPALRELQAKKLTEQSKDPKIERGKEVESADINGLPVQWHRSFDDIPSGCPILVIAQEFFDCLPVHQLEYTATGWCEKFIEMKRDRKEGEGPFMLALSRQPTASSILLMHAAFENYLSEGESRNPEIGQQIDVCPDGVALSQAIAKRVNEDGGAAIIVDYGMDHSVSDSIKAIKDHKFVDLLEDPGTVDLSAVIDFSALKRAAAREGAGAFGTIDQGPFLRAMGIDVRVNELLKDAKTREQADRIISSYKRLVDQDEMGKVYKVISIASKSVGTPPGF